MEGPFQLTVEWPVLSVSIVVVQSIFLLLEVLVKLGSVLDGASDHVLNVVALVSVEQAELAEVYRFLVVPVDHVEHQFVIRVGHVDAAKLKALYKLMELDGAIEVDVELAEGFAIVFELLLEAQVDDSEQLLDVVQLLRTDADVAQVGMQWIAPTGCLSPRWKSNL